MPFCNAGPAHCLSDTPTPVYKMKVCPKKIVELLKLDFTFHFEVKEQTGLDGKSAYPLYENYAKAMALLDSQ